MRKNQIAKPRAARVVQAGRFEIKLRSVGNPDHGQYAPISDPATVYPDTLAEASLMCRKYIAEWDMGGGNWPDTFVTKGGRKVARISYNGRVWGMDGKEIEVEELSDREAQRQFAEYQRTMGPKIDAAIASLHAPPRTEAKHTDGYALDALVEQLQRWQEEGADSINFGALAEHPETDDGCTFADLIKPAAAELARLRKSAGLKAGAMVRALAPEGVRL